MKYTIRFRTGRCVVKFFSEEEFNAYFNAMKHLIVDVYVGKDCKQIYEA